MPVTVAPRLPAIAFVERRTRAQRTLGFVALTLVVLFVIAKAVATVLLDRWWFDTVTVAPVWSTRTAAQVELAAGAIVIVVLALGSTLWVCGRVARLIGDDQRPRYVARYHQRVGPAHRWLLWGVSLYVLWRAIGAAVRLWQPFLLYRHGGDLDVDVPRIGGDLGFYLFRLPFLNGASAVLRSVLVVAIVMAAYAHAASGAFRPPWSRRRSEPAAVLHLAILAMVLLGVQAIHEAVVSRAMTAVSPTGAYDGAGYTELHVLRPGYLVAALSAIALGFVIVRAATKGGWRLAAVGAAACAAVHVVVLLVAPVAVERLVVAPAVAQRQLWAIGENLTATRTAYGLDGIETVDQADLPAEPADVSIPIFATASLPRSMQVLAGTPGTRVSDVDVVDADGQLVYTAARNASRPDLPERGWVQEHLVYTHGNGLLVWHADRADADGRPDRSAVAGAEGADSARIYYGEGLDGWYAITSTQRDEVGGGSYDGPGIAVGSFGRRVALALAFGEPQPVLTSELTDDAKLLYRRGLVERVNTLAPFLTWDSDPYAVAVGDRVTWVIDGYATATTYPYSQLVRGNAANLPNQVNYVRLAVHATVDATDGSVHLYRTDGGDDPIVSTWARIFPDLFDDAADMPDGIAAQLRYPTDLFQAQSGMLGRYHVADAETLFNGAERWSVSPGVVPAVGGTANARADATDLVAGDGFAAVRPYNPGDGTNPGSTRDLLSGFAVGQHGRDLALSLVVAQPGAALGPQVAQAAIEADPEITQAITLLNANGSKVEFGPMTPVVSSDGVAWVRAITVLGAGSSSPPRLYGVAVVLDGEVTLGDDVDSALAEAFAG